MQLPTQPVSSTGGAKRWRTLQEARARFEKRYLIAALKRANGCVAEVARIAGRDRNHLHNVLKRHGIKAADYRQRLRPSRTSGAGPSKRQPELPELPKTPRTWFGVVVR